MNAFVANKYVLAVYEMELWSSGSSDLCSNGRYVVPWDNKAPMAIVNMIDEFIQVNW